MLFFVLICLIIVHALILLFPPVTRAWYSFINTLTLPQYVLDLSIIHCAAIALLGRTSHEIVYAPHVQAALLLTYALVIFHAILTLDAWFSSEFKSMRE